MYKEGKVILRALEEEDLKKSIFWVNDEETARLINRFSPVAYSNHLKWYQSVINDHTKAIFAIDKDQEREYIGNCALINIDHRNQKAELWIYLSKSVQGKGIGTDAVKCLLKYAFNKLNLNRVYLYVMDYNICAIDFYKKLGFKEEGRFRENVFTDGKFCDTVHMAILRSEFIS